MHVLLGGLLAMALAPSGDPRSIDPAANRPEIVSPVGPPATVPPVKVHDTRRKRGTKPEASPTVAQGTSAKPPAKPRPEAKTQPKPRPEPKARRRARPGDPPVDDGPGDTGEGLARCLPEHGLCWRLNMAGIAAASVGVAAIGTGIGFMQAPQYAVPEEPVFNRSLRPPGVMMISVGAVALVTGVVMIVVGHATHGKPRRSSNMAQVQLVPGGLRW